MKIVIQRVQSASVVIEDSTVGAIKQGLLLLVGVGPEDTKEDLEYAVRKIVNMRIFSDEDGKMNLSVKDIGGQIWSISFFRICKKRKLRNRQKEIDRHLRVLQSLTWLASSMTISTNPCQLMFL